MTNQLINCPRTVGPTPARGLKALGNSGEPGYPRRHSCTAWLFSISSCIYRIRRSAGSTRRFGCVNQFVWPTERVLTVADLSEETEALVQALANMAANLPSAALALRERKMSRERQHTLGSLLTQLGELVHQHADTYTEPSNATKHPPSSMPVGFRRDHFPP